MSLIKLKAKYCKLDASQRLYGLDIPVVGLTGGIATGKSTVSKSLRAMGIPVIDADSLIKDIYKMDSTIELVSKVAPKAIKENEIDFKTLRAIFFNDESIKSQLEAHLYSLLPQAFKSALGEYTSPEVVIYDVPLLFEKKLDQSLDFNAVVYCPKEQQVARLISRDSIDENLAQRILSNQLPIDEKKRLANYVIDNSKDISNLEVEIRKFSSKIFEII